MSTPNRQKYRTTVRKWRKHIFGMLFSYQSLMVLLLLLQIAVLFSMFRWFATFIPYLFGSSMVFSVFMALVMLNSPGDATGKMTWMIVMMAMPIFGPLLYLYTRSDLGHRALKKRIRDLDRETRFDLNQATEVLHALTDDSPGAAAMCRYVNRKGDHPVFSRSRVTYLPSGEDKLEALLTALQGARSFIFMEYFILEDGMMWQRILQVLQEKAAHGVEVRLLIDGTCEFTRIPHSFPKKMQALGIHCKFFAPATPFMSTHYNYRDHRKIAVIDGHTAFTGGINLSDEYINLRHPFGHWKDTALMLEGEAARSFTLMFLRMWTIDVPLQSTEFIHYQSFPAPIFQEDKGFVMPFGDCPLDDDKVGEAVYSDLLHRAQRYVHIMTPYLILDGVMENALIYAAERGVDVHLILPGIPDKKTAWYLARTHYARLLEAGVKISEYTPGFVHAKVFVADDLEAVVGTINLDYRSLYHHFECAAYVHGCSCIADIERDFQRTLSQSRLITPADVKHFPWHQRVLGSLLKAIAPLM